MQFDIVSALELLLNKKAKWQWVLGMFQKPDPWWIPGPLKNMHYAITKNCLCKIKCLVCLYFATQAPSHHLDKQLTTIVSSFKRGRGCPLNVYRKQFATIEDRYQLSTRVPQTWHSFLPSVTLGVSFSLWMKSCFCPQENEIKLEQLLCFPSLLSQSSISVSKELIFGCH